MNPEVIRAVNIQKYEAKLNDVSNGFPNEGLVRMIIPKITDGIPKYWNRVGRSLRNIIAKVIGMITCEAPTGARSTNGTVSIANM